MTYEKNLFKKKTYLTVLTLVLIAGFCVFFSLDNNTVEARFCPGDQSTCAPPGPQGPVGVGGGDSLTAPGIERCEKDDIDDTAKCKDDYRDCNRRDTQAEKVRCKIKAINDHKKSGDGGGDGAGPGGGDPKPTGIGRTGEYVCGTFDDDEKNVHTKFDFGCIGTQYAKNGQGPKNVSPILDLTYAFVRFLSVGVGIVLAAAIIISGIQYSMSEGNAEVTQKAKARIRSAILGLAIYIFAFSILQYLVPGGVFNASSWLNENALQLILRTIP